MNWELIKRDKDGELNVNIFLVGLLVVFFGFLFGLGLSIAYVVVDAIYNGDGFYIYYFFREFWVALVFAIIFTLFVYFERRTHEKGSN